MIDLNGPGATAASFSAPKRVAFRIRENWDGLAAEEGLLGGFLDRIRRNWRDGTRVLDDPERLGHEVVRLHSQGRYADAVVVARRLVDRQRARLGPRHPDYATAVGNLGLLLQQQGAVEEAEPLLIEALNVRREAFGESHPQYAKSLIHLADLLQLRGQLDAAEPLLRQALGVQKDVLGDAHPDHAGSLTALAHLLDRRGDPASAEPLLRQALAIREDAQGSRHPMYATAMSNLGLILLRQGDVSSAEPLLRQALVIRNEVLGETHPDSVESRGHLETLVRDRVAPNTDAGGSLAELGVPEVPHPIPFPPYEGGIEGGSGPSGAEFEEIPSNSPWVNGRVVLDTPNGRQPESFVTVNTTESLAPTLPPNPSRNGSTHPSPITPELPSPSERGTNDIADRLNALAAEYALVAEGLAEASRHSQSLNSSLLDRAEGCHGALLALRDEMARQAAPIPADKPPTAPVEEPADPFDTAHVLALRVLDRAFAARARKPDEAELLDPYREAVASLRHRLATSTHFLSDEILTLADGSHPIAAVLRLASGEKLPDPVWVELFDTATAAFGRPLASAAARARISVPRP